MDNDLYVPYIVAEIYEFMDYRALAFKTETKNHNLIAILLMQFNIDWINVPVIGVTLNSYGGMVTGIFHSGDQIFCGINLGTVNIINPVTSMKTYFRKG